MIAMLLRLFALRPLLTMAIFGVPILVLVAIGLFTIIALKVLVFIVFPILLVIWIVRRIRRDMKAPTPTPDADIGASL